jgi:hypothetical protein
LLRHEVFDLIKANSHHVDLTVSWYLPETVRHEREYQLQKQSLELLPSIQKLEKLLGHNLFITEQIIIQRVHEGIEKQIQDLNLTVLPTDPARVDWKRIMLDAAYRQPPFSVGEREKGFRDALIAEAFLQLVESSPTTPSVCRIGFVTGDALLTQAIKDRIGTARYVRILPTLEELKGLISTLVSEVAEEFVQDIKGYASDLFFQPGNANALYSKENILKRIFDNFSEKVNELPEGADERKHTRTVIGRARFKKKEGQRTYWVNRITIREGVNSFV